MQVIIKTDIPCRIHWTSLVLGTCCCILKFRKVASKALYLVLINGNINNGPITLLFLNLVHSCIVKICTMK